MPSKYTAREIVARAIQILGAHDYDHAGGHLEAAALAIAGLVAAGRHRGCVPAFPSIQQLADLSEHARKQIATEAGQAIAAEARAEKEELQRQHDELMQLIKDHTFDPGNAS